MPYRLVAGFTLLWLGLTFEFLLVSGATAVGFPPSVGIRLVVVGLPIPLLLTLFGSWTTKRQLVVFLGGCTCAVWLLRLTLPFLGWTHLAPASIFETRSFSVQLYAIYMAAGVALIIFSISLKRSKRLIKALLASVLVLSAASAFSTMHYLRNLGLLPFAQGGYIASYVRLWENLDRFYVHWEDSPMAPGELRSRYYPQVREASNRCGPWGDCPQYTKVIRNMLAELQDGHTRVVSGQSSLLSPELTIREVQGHAVVTDVRPNSAAQNSGCVPGMIIRSVDGLSTEDALANVPGHLTAYSAPHTRQHKAYQHLLSGTSPTVSLGADMPNGHRKAMTLARTQWRRKKQLPSVTGWRTPRNYGYIAIRALSPGNADSFDSLLDSLTDIQGLILDLRGNPGGASRTGNAIVGRLVQENQDYGRECYRGGHPLIAQGVKGCYPVRVDVRANPFTGPIAVLLDGNVASSAERMALALCDKKKKNIQCIGRRTAGDSGNPVLHFLPGLVVRYSAGRLYRTDGRPLNGTGVSPHSNIDWTLDNIFDGQDPDMAAAMAWFDSMRREM